MFSFTLGRSLMWFASKRSSSKLLEYLKISSGTADREQWRLSTVSTCRLHPLKNAPGMHLNIMNAPVITNHSLSQTLHCFLSSSHKNWRHFSDKIKNIYKSSSSAFFHSTHSLNTRTLIPVFFSCFNRDRTRRDNRRCLTRSQIERTVWLTKSSEKCSVGERR